MAERIVSPGVFTRERDLSFLPVGIGEIGAAIIGPTRKGPSFVPTVVTSYQDFTNIFGESSKDFYTPYTVREYLKSAGSVTVVKVGYLGGYSAGCIHLTVSGALGNTTHISHSFPSTVVATFAPSALNSDGLGSVSGSVGTAGGAGSLISASKMELELAGANATASLTNASIFEAGSGFSGTLFSNNVGSNIHQPSIGSSDAPVYTYKHFRSSISASIAGGLISNDSQMSIELQTSGLDFSGGSTTVNDTTYVTTISGNTDAQAARTPMIQSQDPVTDLFRIYMRMDGDASNQHYVVISNIKRPQNSNSSPDYAEFSLELRKSNGDLLEGPYVKLNLDPDSANYLPKVIGDQFQITTTAGEVVTHGDWPNMSQYMRVGDYDVKTFEGTPSLQPMGFAAILEPIVSTAACPSASMVLGQTKLSDTSTYVPGIPYGYRLNTDYFTDDELWTNYEYLAPIPKNAVAGTNAAFSLENMYGFGDSNSQEQTTYTNFQVSTGLLQISSSATQLKFAAPFQQGFDGANPGIKPKTGGDIVAGNTQGFDCSTALSSGSVAYKRAIDTVSNPDEIDINMLVTPGVIHSLHSTVTNHAMDKVEARADAFYVMDTAAWGDNVSTAVSNVATLDSNYVATYYPWVKMDDPDAGGGVWVPPSVVIPGVIAFTDSVAHEWFAPAGLNRGGLSSVRMAKKKLTHTDRDRLYEARVNPIATFPNQGVVVFGQKTLQAKPSALDRINVRRLLIRLKKFIASSSRFLVFEQNDSSTRARFLNIVNPFLESVQANSGLSAFKVVMDDSNNTPDVIDRNQLIGQIFIQPTRTAEFIVLDFTVLPTGAAFPE